MSTKGKTFGYRMKLEIAARMADLEAATERDRSFFLDKALDEFLPVLEKRYARELQEYYSTHPTGAVALNDAISSSRRAEIAAEGLAVAKAAVSYRRSKTKK